MRGSQVKLLISRILAEQPSRLEIESHDDNYLEHVREALTDALKIEMKEMTFVIRRLGHTFFTQPPTTASSMSCHVH